MIALFRLMLALITWASAAVLAKVGHVLLNSGLFMMAAVLICIGIGIVWPILNARDPYR